MEEKKEPTNLLITFLSMSFWSVNIVLTERGVNLLVHFSVNILQIYTYLRSLGCKLIN